MHFGSSFYSCVVWAWLLHNLNIMPMSAFPSLVFVIAGKPTGYDRVRNAEIGNKDFELDILDV